MKVRIQMVFETEDGKSGTIEEIALLERGSLRPQDLGLTLTEAKTLLHGMQQTMITEQVEQYLGQFKACAHCRHPPNEERATRRRLSHPVWQTESH